MIQNFIKPVARAQIKSRSVTRHTLAMIGFAGLLTISHNSQAQAIFVPNHSFESPSGVGFPFDTTPILDSWQKIAEPGYYAGTIELGTGVPWMGTAGAFVNASAFNTTPYGNVTAAQAGYILAFPQVTLFQDYDSSPTHDFNATFEIGKSYNLTVGVFGKSRFPGAMAPGATFEMSLYYRDALGDRVSVGSTIITYSEAAFPTAAGLNLIDFAVNVPTVQAGDDWAGKHIGIQFESTLPLELAVFGSWDFDNVRLTAVPEPTALALVGIGFGGMLLRRSRQKS